MDDYIGLDESKEIATQQYWLVRATLNMLGLPIGDNAQPAQIMTLLGVKFDTIKMRAFLSGHKLKETTSLITTSRQSTEIAINSSNLRVKHQSKSSKH